MTYSRDGQTIKQFRAVRPTTKHMAARALPRASAGNAQRFLTALVQTMLFPVADVAAKLLKHGLLHDYGRTQMGLDCRTPNEGPVRIEKAACPD